jgi:hypothetical protein
VNVNTPVPLSNELENVCSELVAGPTRSPPLVENCEP